MKHHHSHIALLMIALSITVFICALYAYMHIAIGASVERATAAREAVEKERIYHSQRQNLVNLYNESAEDRALLSTFFVADDQKVPFIEKVESFGTATGAQVTLSGIVADDLASSPPGTLGRMSVRVDATGSWASVMRVLKLAETIGYKSSVSGVRVDYVGVAAGKTPYREWRISFILDAVSIRRAL